MIIDTPAGLGGNALPDRQAPDPDLTLINFWRTYPRNISGLKREIVVAPGQAPASKRPENRAFLSSKN
jgi:hypothetical protein